MRGLDAPWGLIGVHDLLGATLAPEPGVLRDLLRPLPRVRDEVPITDLLQRMRAERGQMVLVSDGEGATIGLITLEDLLEELVGEIEEEAVPAGTS